jgi:hypothetical protein
VAGRARIGGVERPDMPLVFPNIGRFSTSDLCFIV